jgi:membrane-bound lytic murein transglycosylase D
MNFNKLILAFLLLPIQLYFSVRVSYAESPEFKVPASLEERVHFWVLIFTKYGKYQSVFHHRQDPGVIYSVLDFTELSEKNSGAKYEAAREQALEEEESRIRAVLLSLADGKTAETPFERRIERMFSRFPGFRRSRIYREAAEGDQIRSQSGIRERFMEGVKRSRRYLHAIEQIFAQKQLPLELARLPLVESSFDYNAYSVVGAAGIWQFMRGTGKKYMRIDSIIDERRDPIISSRAAAEYLAHANSVINAWPLAVTSYNHGITGVMRAAREVGSKDIAKIIESYEGKSFGFASKSFFVSFLAALEAEKNWKGYFPELEVEAPWYFDEVRLGRSVRFSELVKISGADRERMVELNPALLKPVIAGSYPVPAGYLVKLPHGFGPKLVAALPGSQIYSIVDAPLVNKGKKSSEVNLKKPVKKKTVKNITKNKPQPAKVKVVNKSKNKPKKKPKSK